MPLRWSEAMAGDSLGGRGAVDRDQNTAPRCDRNSSSALLGRGVRGATDAAGGRVPVRMRVFQMNTKQLRNSAGTLTALLLCAGAGVVCAFSFPFEVVFRSAVAESDYVVIGHIVGTAPVDSTVSERVSYLQVDDIVVGKVISSEPLPVEWHAAEWYPGEDVVARRTDTFVPLSELEGVTALWCLGFVRDSSADPRVMWPLCEPLLLTRDNLDQVKSCVEVLPKDVKFKRVRPEPEDMEGRIFAVSTKLESWIKRLQ